MKIRSLAAIISSLIMLMISSVFISAESAYMYGNEIIKKDGNYHFFSETDIKFLDDTYDISLNFMTDKSAENVDNEYLGLSEDYKIKKYETENYNIYDISPITENTSEEIDMLFESAKKLLEEGKIQNAYKRSYISYSTAEKRGNGYYRYADAMLCTQRTYLVYEEKYKNEVISGDLHEDCKIDVRDAATIASKLAKAEILSLSADYNNDGKSNVRDAAAIAGDLAVK